MGGPFEFNITTTNGKPFSTFLLFFLFLFSSFSSSSSLSSLTLLFHFVFVHRRYRNTFHLSVCTPDHHPSTFHLPPHSPSLSIHPTVFFLHFCSFRDVSQRSERIINISPPFAILGFYFVSSVSGTTNTSTPHRTTLQHSTTPSWRATPTQPPQTTSHAHHPPFEASFAPPFMIYKSFSLHRPRSV